MIEVNRVDSSTFRVVVNGRSATVHNVTVDPGYYRSITGGAVPVETLVRQSFEFLLDREPNTEILSSFDLPDIGHYFPEYETAMRNRLA